MGMYPAQEEGKHQRSENPAIKRRGKEEPSTVLIRYQRGLSNSESSINTALHAQRWGWNHGHGERAGPKSIHLQCCGFGLGGNPPSLDKQSHKNPALPPLLWHTQQFAQVRLQPSLTFCHGEEQNRGHKEQVLARESPQKELYKGEAQGWSSEQHRVAECLLAHGKADICGWGPDGDELLA